jgi:hypothetical protein
MSLQYAPSVTFSAPGNAIALGTTLAAGASTNLTVDFSQNMLGGFVQFWATGGSVVASPSGLQVQGFTTADTAPNWDTISFGALNYVIPFLATATARQTIQLSTGKYRFTLSNLDTSNPITIGVSTAPMA